MTGLEAVDRAEARTKANVSSGLLTAEGAKADARQFILTDLIPNIRRARTTIQKAKIELAERRSKFKLGAPDPSDIAAALRRQEIRSHFKALSPDEREAYFRRGEVSPDVATALLELPPRLQRHPAVPTRAHDQGGAGGAAWLRSGGCR